MATDLEIINSALTKLGAGLITSAQKTGGTTKEARLAVERLPHLRKAMLRSHPWNKATKRVDSVNITTTGAHGTGTVAVSALTSALPSGLVITFSGGIALTLNASAAIDALVLSGTIPSGAIALGETASTWTSVGSALANTVPDFGYAYSVPLPTDLLRLLNAYDLDKEYRVEGSNLISDSASPDILYIYDMSETLFDPTMAEALAFSLALDISYAITQSQGITDMLAKQHAQSLSLAKTQDAQEDGRYYLEANLFDESRYGNSIFTDYRNHYRP
jgi:hypothetical protein